MIETVPPTRTRKAGNNRIQKRLMEDCDTKRCGLRLLARFLVIVVQFA